MDFLDSWRPIASCAFALEIEARDGQMVYRLGVAVEAVRRVEQLFTALVPQGAITAAIRAADLEHGWRLVASTPHRPLETARPATVARAVLASRRADHQRTIRLLKGATASHYITPEVRGDVYEALAAAYAANGTPNRAIRLLRQCIEAVVDKEEAVSQLVGYKSLLAEHLTLAGARDEARVAVSDATDTAARISSPSTRGRLLWVAGKAAWMAGDPDAAKRHMNQASAILEAIEDTLALARAHLLNARMLALNAETGEAAAQLEQAERLIELVGDRDNLGVLRAEQAKLAARIGDAETAVMQAREAEELLVGDVRHEANAQHALGVAYAAAGDIDAADTAFKSAVDLMEERSQHREAAQIAREWARALREAGREAEAFSVMERATLIVVRNMGAEARTRAVARDIPDSWVRVVRS